MNEKQHLTRYERFKGISSAVTLFMVAALFLLWGVFGSITVEHQNEAILRGVHEQLQDALAQSAENGKAITAQIEETDRQTKAIVCVLLIDPDRRTDANVERCLKRNGVEP